MQVEAELALVLQNGKAFGVSLHQSVFDAVVNHFGEVAGAHRPNPAPTSIRRRRERLEDRLESLDHDFIATDHHAVALGQPPYAAAGAAVDVANFLVGGGG